MSKNQKIKDFFSIDCMNIHSTIKLRFLFQICSDTVKDIVAVMYTCTDNQRDCKVGNRAGY